MYSRRFKDRSPDRICSNWITKNALIDKISFKAKQASILIFNNLKYYNFDNSRNLNFWLYVFYAKFFLLFYPTITTFQNEANIPAEVTKLGIHRLASCYHWWNFPRPEWSDNNERIDKWSNKFMLLTRPVLRLCTRMYYMYILYCFKLQLS